MIQRLILSLAVLICVASPLCIGGVLPIWTPVIAGAASLLILGLGLLAGTNARTSRVNQKGRAGRGPWAWLALAVPALCAAIQIVPLPASWSAALSPQAASLLEGGRLLPLTLDVPATTFELARSLSLIGLALAVEALCGDRRRSRLVLRALVAIGLIQVLAMGGDRLFGRPGHILGVYPLPSYWSASLGTFLNRNHAASLLVLTGAVTVGLALEAGWRSALFLWVAFILQLGTLVLSQSRGGLLAAGVSATLCCGFFLARRTGVTRSLLIGAGLSIAAGALTVIFVPGFAQRLHPIWDGSIWAYQKVRVWRDAIALCASFPLFGVGRGAFESAFPPYRTGDEYVSVPYPASMPLQHATEMGLLLTLLQVGMGLWLMRLLWQRRARLQQAEMGVAAGLLGVLCHGLVEFSLELPGVSLPVVAALGVLCGRAFRPGGRIPARWLLAGGGILVLATLGSLWARPRLLLVERERVRKALAAARWAEAEAAYQRAVKNHPADGQVALLGASSALLRGEAPATVLGRVNRVLVLHPADAQAHRIAARALAQAGLRQQAALELRLAGTRGWWLDEASLDEARVLVGDRHLIDAVQQAPEALHYLAAYQERRGRWDEARRSRERAGLFTPGW